MTTPEIQALEAALRAAKEAESQAARLTLAALPREYDWTVVQKSPHVFSVTKKLTAASIEAFNAWKAANPKASYSSPWMNLDRREGMDYLLIGNMLAMVGGGTLVLKSTPPGERDTFSHEPRELTPFEEAELRALRVPDSLKR